MWGATQCVCAADCRQWISIHAPRVGSDGAAAGPGGGPAISIHAPRVGSDSGSSLFSLLESPFQSTLPVWGATTAAGVTVAVALPKFQSTLPVWGATCYHAEISSEIGFQSTLPVWGATVGRANVRSHIYLFQSTLPVWGATGGRPTPWVYQDISIHAPRVGSDAPG